MKQPAQLARETALHNCRIFASRDMDETRAGVSRLMNPYFVEYAEGRKDCEAHLDFLQMRGLAIAAIKQLGHIRINVAPIECFHFLIFCLKGRALLSSSHGEATIDSRTGLYFGPGQRFQGDLPDDCEQLVVRIDAAAFQSYAGASNAGLRAFVDLSQPELGPWLHLLNAMISDPSAIDLLQRNDKIARDYEQLFMSLLFSGQGYSRAPSGSEAYKGAAPASIRRAEMFIEANAREALRLEDIAAAANVPTRTLLDGFRRFRQTSPGRFLRDIRLDRARASLLERDGEASVTAAALEAGFTHLGRFARDYAVRFSEKPSETLARGSKRRSSAFRRD